MKRYNFIIFGDSITYGAWDHKLGGWVNRLRMVCENSDPDNRYNVFNLGISGQITSEILERFDRECIGRINLDQNNLIIIAIGINDAQVDHGNFKTTPDLFKENIQHLINKAKSYTSNILFVGLTKVDETNTCPRPTDKNKFYYNKHIEEYDTYIREICQLNAIDYLYVYDILERSDLSDGLHPNDIGHQKMSDIIKKKVDSILENML